MTTLTLKKDKEQTPWQDLKPGDFVTLYNGDICPADIVVLNTSLAKGGGKICWVDTQGVEGFTSYDMKRAVQATRSVRNLLAFSGWLTYEPPNGNISRFKGFIKTDGSFYNEQLSIDNLILRGSVIKNTDL